MDPTSRVTDRALALLGGAGSADLVDTLLDYWTLDEASGTRASSKAGGNALTPTGVTITAGAGVIANGAFGNGTDRLAGTNAYGARTLLSIAGWTKAAVFASNLDWISLGDSSATGIITLAVQSGQVNVKIKDSGGNFRVWNFFSAIPDDSAWHYSVAVFDSSQGTVADRCKVYVDGALKTPGAAPGACSGLNLSTPLLLVGGNDTNWNGGVDEVGVWSVALSLAQVERLFVVDGRPWLAGPP